MAEKRTKEIKAWAIKLPYADHAQFPAAGIFWFQTETPQPWQGGCRTALFQTREHARRWNRERGCKGQVVRVLVTIRELRK